MKNPFNHFDRIFLINLPERTDRLMESLDECAKVGIQNRVEIREGIKTGPQGLTHVMHRILSEVDSSETILIMEDDVKFVNNPTKTLTLAMEQIQWDDWDMLYLGALTKQRLHLRYPSWYRLKYGYCCHAIVFNRRIIPTVRLLLQSFLDKDAVVDRLLAGYIQPIYSCYLISPMIADQRPSFSDLENKVTDYGLLKHFENMQSYTKPR